MILVTDIFQSPPDQLLSDLKKVRDEEVALIAQRKALEAILRAQGIDFPQQRGRRGIKRKVASQGGEEW